MIASSSPPRSPRPLPDDAPDVLVVEDDVDVADTLVRLLAAVGCRGSVARDGARALRLLREATRPRVIVLDLRMPNMDGETFRRAQLLDPELAAIPTIVITADRRAPDPSLGAAAWFAKPFDCGALLDAIKRRC